MATLLFLTQNELKDKYDWKELRNIIEIICKHYKCGLQLKIIVFSDLKLANNLTDITEAILNEKIIDFEYLENENIATNPSLNIIFKF